MKAVVVLQDACLEMIDFSDTLVIGVEGGCKLLIENNIKIDFSVGDFDSIDKDYLKVIKEKSEKFIKLSEDKDNTDTFYAVSLAYEFCDEVEVHGGTSGSRIEHLYANINLLCVFGYLKIISKDTLMYTTRENEIFYKDEYKYISFFALENVDELTLIDFKYELDKYRLKRFDNICISNEIDGLARLVMSNGRLLVIKTKKEDKE